jgi:hypothetical protein
MLHTRVLLRCLPAVAVIPLVVSGCCSGGDVLSLAEARARWAAAGLQDYEYTFSLQCFCVPDYVQPVRIVVREGQVVSRTYASGGQAPDQPFAQYDTVEKLFARIEQAFLSGAARIHAEYDPVLGYPRNFYIDQSEMIADEEIGGMLRDFVQGTQDRR